MFEMHFLIHLACASRNGGAAVSDSLNILVWRNTLPWADGGCWRKYEVLAWFVMVRRTFPV